MRSTAVLAAVCLACGTLTGCNSTAGSDPPGSGISVRLIVQFRSTVNPADPAFLAQLSKSLGTPIAYIRPISGGAHVLHASVRPEAVTELVQRLQQRPEVVDVQADVPVRRQ